MTLQEALRKGKGKASRLENFIKRVGEGVKENDFAWLLSKACTCKEGKNGI